MASRTAQASLSSSSMLPFTVPSVRRSVLRLAAALWRHKFKTLAATSASMLLYGAYYRAFVVHKPRLYYNRNNPYNTALLARCPSVRQEYRPTFWATDRHMQLLLFIAHSMSRLLWQRRLKKETVTFSDGGVVSLDWDHEGLQLPSSAPVILLNHGITGTSFDMLSWMVASTKRGYRAVSMNRRGHSDPLSPKSPKFSVYGDVSDFSHVVDLLHTRYPEAPLFVMGISAGTCALSRYMGEVGSNTPVLAALCVSPGYDCRMVFKDPHPFYDRFLLYRLKSFFLKRYKEHFVPWDAKAYDGALKATTVDEFVRKVTPFTGHDDFDKYLSTINPEKLEDKIKKPFLCISASDDPIVVESVVEHYIPSFGKSETGILVATKRGSHCAFFEGLIPRMWSHRVVFEFVEAVLAEHTNFDSC